ncbi:SUF system NifU family Fe-S cluster assembly protein [Candidatus Roizmanbacteria bacterium]|nr:SUF system NifU family Fe-S cluster assembly protein [Candidatus Roizmanbacteria bacterium]
MSIYREIILDHYKNPHNFGTLKNSSKNTSVSNPLCGDKIEMDIFFEKNKVNDVSFRAQGCAISQASASLLTDYTKGKTKEELKKLDKDFMIKLLGVELGVNRVKCALLPLEALHKLL